MLSQSLAARGARALSTKAKPLKVAVLGASGGIGQPLALLCKLSPLIDEVACYDVVGTPGVAADLSHCPTPAKVTGNLPAAETWPPSENVGLKAALTGCDVVVIPAGVPRKPGMTRDDLFNTNASIVKTLVEGCGKYCPDATLAIISNPVNSTVPIAAEVLKKMGVYNPKKLCGVTTLDVCRANTFVAANQERLGLSPKDVNVTVIGGHAGITILPLLSQVPNATFSDADREALTVRIQFGGDEVVKAKAGAGSATLSMAYAGYLFTEGVIKAMKGEDITMCAYVESSLTDAPYFASPCKFGPDGVKEVLPFGPLSAYEQSWFDKMMPELKAQIAKGIEFAK
ncbi:hypothetical protein AB1Y20_004285 [Prymnesium parvum]|uniref:Malate dehydrogenase n=1 Tax=Prymnesium parvum TaxID=97485 RepID=A0AB34IXR5_PRYPA